MLNMNKSRIFVFLTVLICSIMIGVRSVVMMQRYFDRKREVANYVMQKRCDCIDGNAWMQKQVIGCGFVDLSELKQTEFCILNSRCADCSECLYLGAIRDILECAGSLEKSCGLNEYEMKDLCILRDELRFGLCINAHNSPGDQMIDELTKIDLSIATIREFFGFYKSMNSYNSYYDKRVERIVCMYWPERIEYADCSLCMSDSGLKKIVNLKSYVIHVISRYIARCNEQRERWDICILNVLTNIKDNMKNVKDPSGINKVNAQDNMKNRKDAIEIGRLNVQDDIKNIDENHKDEYIKNEQMKYVEFGDILRSFFFFVYYEDIMNDDELFDNNEKIFLGEKGKREFSRLFCERLTAFNGTDMEKCVENNDANEHIEYEMIEETINGYSNINSGYIINKSKNAIEKYYECVILRIVDKSRFSDALDVHEKEFIIAELRRVAIKRCRSIIMHHCERIEEMTKAIEGAVRMSVTMGKYMWKINEAFHELEHADEIPEVNRRRIANIRTKLAYTLECIACHGKADMNDACTRAIVMLLGLQNGGLDRTYLKNVTVDNAVVDMLKRTLLCDRSMAHANAVKKESVELWRYASAVLMKYFDECEAEEKANASLDMLVLSGMNNLIDVVDGDGVSVINEYISIIKLVVTEVMCDELKWRLKHAIYCGMKNSINLKHALDKRRRMISEMISIALLVCDSDMEGLLDIPNGFIKMIRKVLGKNAAFAERVVKGNKCRIHYLVLQKIGSKYSGIRCLFGDHEFRLADAVSRAVAEFIETEPGMTKELFNGVSGD
ncbi:hypothetical protein M896_040850 [Ordospora colligata OC4]|uniref:Uncharacterized protein n=1 Tax=Ordospora colligata OC4 TaxID=1354746 RepID=A0A0B2ULM8_9MICR|nr:uncharacterized protein M896_040850 [Ordospora colligata OC4]KHN69890.1 hypothetical protein M896_040850 [Ordospora colligata OC4]TBU16060.1 hypothetical protein CWI41_040850 [Ordospora colligata]TBU16273.1 hypothetical protein CWI40_040850 [Ordospora colligata]